MDAVIILCAGRGTRMAQLENKVLTIVAGLPVFIWSVMAFEQALNPGIIILVGQTGEISRLKETMIQYCPEIHERTVYVVGGETRQESVQNGLNHLKPLEVESIYIHDGARPMVDDAIIQTVKTMLTLHSAVCVGMPLKDTIKCVTQEGVVVNTPNRSDYWIIQTPQAFSKSILIEAYEKAQNEGMIGTDDASLVEWSGQRVHMAKGSYENLKITTPEDLIIAGLLLEKRR